MRQRANTWAAAFFLLLPVTGGVAAPADRAPTREDLARALIAVERAYRAAPPEGAALAAANREFDAATVAFFLGDGASALRRLDELARALGGAAPAPASASAGANIRWTPIRERLGRLLGETAVPPALAAAAASVEARIGLLVDDPSPSRSAEFLADRPALFREVVEEIAALRRGEDPWTRRPGRFWRVLPTDGGKVPFTLVAPPAVAEGEPRPLVVALHGAGGDECMFRYGYGAGLLAELAEERGFLLAAPLALRTGAESFDALVEMLAEEYPVDRDRVHLVGHSLGAGVASMISRARPDAVASAALFSPGGFAPAADGVPTLVLAGGLDRIARFAGDPEASGATVRFFPNEGHTLIVAAHLPEAVDWLLARPRRKGSR